MAEPMYRQIAEDLRSKIKSGELEPGSRLPTELELRELYHNASRNTVRDAIRQLTLRGLIETQPGRGTYVVEKIRQFVVPLTPTKSEGFSGGVREFRTAVELQGGKPSAGPPRVEVQVARSDVAKPLQVDPGSQVVSRHQERFIDGSPSSQQTSFYPFDFVTRGATQLLQASDIEPGATKYIEDTLGIKQAGRRDRLVVRQPYPGEITFFRLPETGTILVIVLVRTVYTDDHTPIRHTITTYPADRNHFVIDYGAVPPLAELVGDL
jgi:GntR family transcriptional regulator